MGNTYVSFTADKAHNNGNELQTITTLEIAEMMETEHKEILKKLEGTKNSDGSVRQVGIIPVLN